MTAAPKLSRRTLNPKRAFNSIQPRTDLRGLLGAPGEAGININSIPKSLWTTYDLPIPSTKEEFEAYFTNSDWQFFGQPNQTSRASSMLNTDVSPCDVLVHGIGFMLKVSTDQRGVSGIGHNRSAATISTPRTDGTVPVTGTIPAFDTAGVAVVGGLTGVNPAFAEFSRAAQELAVAFARSRRVRFTLGCDDFTLMNELLADVGLICDDPQYSGMGPYVSDLTPQIREMNDRYEVVAASYGAPAARVFCPDTVQVVGGSDQLLPPATSQVSLIGQKLLGSYGGFFPFPTPVLFAMGQPVDLRMEIEEGTTYWQNKVIEAVSALSAITLSSSYGPDVFTSFPPAGALGKANSEHFKFAHLSITVIIKGERMTSLACAEYYSNMMGSTIKGLSQDAADKVLGGYPIERWLNQAKMTARTNKDVERVNALGSIDAIRSKLAKTVSASSATLPTRPTPLPPRALCLRGGGAVLFQVSSF